MAPLVLEGETLGQKQRHYNKIVDTAVADQAAELVPLNFDDPDVDNLLRIDVACSRRNVEYVLTVLQCDDMLYVSRAIKRSTWLITDDQYANIINPEHLHNELLPKMTSKAKNKLMLAIRLNLKKEDRVDEFFKYYSSDLKVAQKWLPNCSSDTIEKVFTDHAHDINSNTFKRLCEKSINVFKILLKVQGWRYIGNQLAASKILLSKHAEEYIDLIINLNRQNKPIFGIRATQKILQHCPHKIMDNFEKFASHIHLPTFAKWLKKEDIPDFLSKLAGNKEMKHWVKYDNIKHFIKYLPISTRFEFVKQLFINKETAKSEDNLNSELRKSRMLMMSYQSACRSGASTNAGIYRWYRFASFDTAFVDLKKLIRVESSPAERNAIMTILIHCARRNPDHVKTLLQFYRKKHMNEPFKFKVQFVNSIVTLVNTHRFDASTWGILNDIFSSMEVYIESENSVPFCLKAIIVYKLLHNEDIPEIIEKKYTFDTFKEYRKKLEKEEREKLFTYLYNLEMKKLNKQSINNEIEMTMAFDLLSNVLSLLKEWDRKIANHPEVLEKIKQFAKMKKEHTMETNLYFIYTVEKKWRRDMFEESLAIMPNDDTCVNALKHEPELLQRYSTEVEALCSNDAMSLKHTLRRLRIYWAQSLAQKWAEVYFKGLDKPTGHKATIEGLCILLPRKQFLDLLQKYAPVETKIDWSNHDATQLSMQKNIAKRMQLVRPSINLEAALSYAKDDYLQFALPSLNSLLYNMSATQVSNCIPLLFDSPVSLKKHGVRLAYTKLKFMEIKDLVENMWKNTKNSSIKTVLFKETFDLLKKAKKDSAITELWELLSMFIDNLTPDENRVIYGTLSKAEEVPILVRSQMFVKSYTYLNSLPAKANCEPLINTLKYHAPEIMDILEPSFVENSLLTPVPDLVNLMTGKTEGDLNALMPMLSAYIINSENEDTQYAKYEKYLIPVLDGCIESWNTIKKGRYNVRYNISRLFIEILTKTKQRASKKAELYTKMFKGIETKLRTLPLEENYLVITQWSIANLFVESFNEYLKEPIKPEVQLAVDSEQENAVAEKEECSPDNDKEADKWEQICIAVAPSFGKSCLNFVKQDISSQLSSLATCLYKSLEDVFEQFAFGNMGRLITLKNILDSEMTVTYLMVLKGMESIYYYEKDEKRSKMKREIYDIIKSHPSMDVKIYYYEAVNSDPEEFDEVAVPYAR